MSINVESRVHIGSTGTSRSIPHRSVPRVLSIAGTDPTGGAGIHADLKSIAANGGYGMAVMAALVAQNTTGVRSIHVPPVEFLTEQLVAVGDDVTIDAVKIGMLFETPTIATVAAWLQTTRPPVVVLDPVMVAAGGHRLLTADGEGAPHQLIGSAGLVIPNVFELAALLDEPTATTWDECIRQARALSREHGVLVLVKGGHLEGIHATDALVHGTGCSLSAAVVATLRAQTTAWEPAVGDAKHGLTESIAAADQLNVGHGNGPISHFAGLWRRGGHCEITAEAIAQDWWAGIGDVRAAIDDLDFIRGLTDGSLEEAAFAWYVAQDALYLAEYSRVLAEASKLAPTPDEQAFWARSAYEAITAEVELHANWVPPDTVFDTRASRVTTEYVNHLLATVARGVTRS